MLYIKPDSFKFYKLFQTKLLSINYSVKVMIFFFNFYLSSHIIYLVKIILNYLIIFVYLWLCFLEKRCKNWKFLISSSFKTSEWLRNFKNNIKYNLKFCALLVRPGFAKLILLELSLKKIIKAMVSSDKLLKKEPFKTPKSFFFALYHQIQNIQCNFQVKAS